MSRSTAARRVNSTDKNESTVILSNSYASFQMDGSTFQKELSRLLQEKTFLYDGGILGFGLTFRYTYSELDSHLRRSDIAGLRASLTKADKALYALGEKLGLKPELKIVYKMIDYPGISIMSNTLSPFPNPAYPYPPTWENTSGLNGLCRQIGGVLIELSDNWTCGQETLEIEWVAPVIHTNIMPQFITKIDGKSTVSRICGSYILTMSVPRWPQRKAMRANQMESDVVEPKGCHFNKKRTPREDNCPR